MDFKYQYRSQDLEYHHELNQFPDENNFFFHVDPYCEIYGFISGNCYFQVEGTRYELKGPTILILGQGEAHSLNLITKMPYEREVVHFQRFGEAVQLLREKLNQKNVYYMNPAFDM